MRTDNPAFNFPAFSLSPCRLYLGQLAAFLWNDERLQSVWRLMRILRYLEDFGGLGVQRQSAPIGCLMPNAKRAVFNQPAEVLPGTKGIVTGRLKLPLYGCEFLGQFPVGFNLFAGAPPLKKVSAYRA